MDLIAVITIFGIILGVLQGVVIVVLNDVRKEQDMTWKRVNNHYHEVHCDNDACKNLRTGNVVLPQGSL